MVGDGFENPAVALLCLGEIVAVLVHDAQVEQRPEGCRIPFERPLVAGLSLLVVAGTIVEHTERKQRVSMSRVDGDRLLERLGDLAGGAAPVCQNGPLHGPVVGGLTGRFRVLASRHLLDRFFGFVEMTPSPEGIRRGRGAGDGVVSGFLRGIEGFFCLVEGLEGHMGQSLMKERKRPTIRRPERFERLSVATQQILAHAQPHGRGRTAVGELLQFPDRGPHVTVSRGVATKRLCQSADFAGTKWAVAGDELADVDAGGNVLDGGDHEWPLFGKAGGKVSGKGKMGSS